MFEMAQQAASEGQEYDPTSINFYAVCVDKCPSVGDWVCDRTGDAAMAEQTLTTVKLDECTDKTMSKGGAFLSKDPGLLGDELCQNLLEHCWKTDSDTRSIFYRCMPLHNITKLSASGCMYPSSTLAVEDDRCSKKRVIDTTISEQPAKKNYLYDQLNTVFATVMRYFGDIQKSMHIILICGGVGALFVGLFWLIALRYVAGVMVWSSLFFVVILSITFTCFCFSKAGMIGPSDLEMMTGASATDVEAAQAYLAADESNKDAWKYVSYGCSICTVVMLVVIVAMKNKVNIAVGIVKETSKAVHDMKMLMLYPLITTSLLIVLMVWWLIVAAYIISADGLTLNSIKGSGVLNYQSPFSSKIDSSVNETAICNYDHCIYNSTHNVTKGQTLIGEWNVMAIPASIDPGVNATNNNSTGGAFGIDGEANAMRYIMMYHFFGLLWTNQLIQGVAIMVISGAFSKWYFAGPHDVDDEERPEDYDTRMSTPVLKSCCRVVRYHLGSVMFGGFIIAVVQFVRALLAYVEENTKTWQEKNKVSCSLLYFQRM
jgi:choline transporter-like protein 2/4/5